MNTGALDVSANLGILVDRRGTTRFPVQEELKYKVLQPKSMAHSGFGKTLNIGSGGILFTTAERLPVGSQVEIAVNWPARLDGTCPLKFVATGRVTRSEPGKTALRIERYEFRTRGTSNP